MIQDKEFLLQLDKVREKEIYARVTALTFQEDPIEKIEGRVTAGSVNVDGNSAVRRTCSLTIVAENFDYNNYYWGLNTKFKLEVGVRNNIDSRYSDIVWFEQGIFILTSFNTSRSTTNFSISLQGKDKMCLLNGEVGGSIESSVDFGVEETVNRQGITFMKKIPIPTIIRNLVHHYAGEPYQNIVINDLEQYGLELLEYRYDDDLYLYRDANADTAIFDNILINGNTPCRVNGKPHIEKLSDLGPNELDILVDTLTGTATPSKVIIDGKEWYVAKVSFGQTAGYRETDLTYPGDLIANIGESITSVLDKIKNMLSDFEYFYNLQGQFVFQRKQSFINTLWSPLTEADIMNEEGSLEASQYVDSLAYSSAYSYIFSGAELITSFNNNPNLLNMRNDYSVWGTRESIGRQDPVHMRYAIDTKPTQYTSINTTDTEAKKLISEYNKKYDTEMESQNSITYTTKDWDWRELIYRMAQDYFKYAHLFDDFEIRVRAANKELFPKGITGYEHYYTDMISFWRYLYNPELQEKVDKEDSKKKTYDAIIFTLERDIHTDDDVKNYFNKRDIMEVIALPRNIPLIEDLIHYTSEWITEKQKENIANYQEVAATGLYLEQLQNYLIELNSEDVKYTDLSAACQTKIDNYNSDMENYYSDGSHKYWNKNVYEYPESLYFWFDFIDGGELASFNIKTVGARPKVINDTAIKSIYFRETPNVIFTTADSGIGYNSAYKYIQVNDIDGMFSISSQGKSAKDRMDELIYQHGYCVENVTINAIPVYYLQPNTRIYLFDEKAGLNGDYIISKITIPLTYNGTMQITATKAAENII